MTAKRSTLRALAALSLLSLAACADISGPTPGGPGGAGSATTVPPTSSTAPPATTDPTTTAPATTGAPSTTVAPTTSTPTTSTPTATAPTTTTPTTTAPTTTTAPSVGGAGGDKQAWADAASTGVPAGVALKPSGSLVVTEAGAVIDGLDIAGCVQVKAPNVRIRRTRVTCSNANAAVAQTGTAAGLVIEDSELVGGPTGAGTGVYSEGPFTLLRSELSRFHDGLFVSSGSVIEGNWIHDLYQSPGDHNDLIQMVGGQNVRIRYNRLEHKKDQTSAVFLKSDLAPIDDVLIEGNLMAGGAYTVYSMAGNALYGGCCGAPTNIRIVNNTIKAGSYLFGPLMVMGDNVASCNVTDDGKPATIVDSDRGTNPHPSPCAV